MAFDIHFPRQLRGAQLDDYLARGWYRIGQAVFTTGTIDASRRTEQEGEPAMFRVLWLRYRLRDFHFGKKQQKLLIANRKFTMKFQECSLSPQLENLYSSYKSSRDFSIAPTLYQSLYQLEFYEVPGLEVYDSRLISIFDQDRLIAAGIFDQGEKSIAGIINFFEPEYRRYSLGKYLMLLKLRYAQQQDLDFYYPGYISCDFDKFDYKIFPGASSAEVLSPITNKWEPYSPSLMDTLRKEVKP